MIQEGEIKYIKLEKFYNQIKFKGIPMGSAMADRFFLVRSHGKQSAYKTIKEIIFSLIRLFSYLLVPGHKKYHINKLLATKLSNKTHVVNIVNPVINNFPDEITLITNLLKDHKDKKFPIIPISETRHSIRSDFFQIVFVFLKSLFISRKYLNRLSLTRSESLYYSCKMLEQCSIVSFFYDLLNSCKEKPNLVLTEFDRNNISAPLVLTAKKNGIPTATFVHGIIGKYGYVPVLSDYIFCWGNEQKQKLLNFHVPKEKIIVTGTTIIDEFAVKERHNIQNPNNDFRICLGINPVKKELIELTIKMVLDAYSNMSNASLLIKLHPSQSKENFLKYEDKEKRIKILSSNDISNDELFSTIDLLIIENSGLGVEALVFEVPVVVINTGATLDFGKELIEKGKCPVFSDHIELQRIVSELRCNPDMVNQLKINGKLFARNYYHATGVEASKNIQRAISGLLKGESIK